MVYDIDVVCEHYNTEEVQPKQSTQWRRTAQMAEYHRSGRNERADWSNERRSVSDSWYKRLTASCRLILLQIKAPPSTSQCALLLST